MSIAGFIEFPGSQENEPDRLRLAKVRGNGRVKRGKRKGALPKDSMRLSMTGGPRQSLNTTEAITQLRQSSQIAMGTEVRRLDIKTPLAQEGIQRLLPMLCTIGNPSPLTAAVGMAENGQPLLINFQKKSTWNLVVEGPTGCGKSELLRTLAVGLAASSRQAHLQLMGIDIGGRELALLEGLPHMLTDLASDKQFAYEMTDWLAGEVVRRKKTGIHDPHIFLLVDDAEALLGNIEKEILVNLSLIGGQGCLAGVHLIMASRRAVSSPGEDLFNPRSTVKAIPAWQQGRGNSQVIKTPGTFMFKVGEKKTIVQAAWLTAQDLNTATDHIQAGWRTGDRPLTQ